MALPGGFDPSAPAVGGGLFGLPHSAEEAGVVVIPVPWEATVS
jgi:agmatinase